MRIKPLIFPLSVLALAIGFQTASAGAIRYAGKQIAVGTTSAVSAAASGGKTIAAGVATAGQVTGGWVSNHAGPVGNGIMTGVRGTKNFSVKVANGTSSFARKAWKIIW